MLYLTFRPSRSSSEVPSSIYSIDLHRCERRAIPPPPPSPTSITLNLFNHHHHRRRRHRHHHHHQHNTIHLIYGEETSRNHWAYVKRSHRNYDNKYKNIVLRRCCVYDTWWGNHTSKYVFFEVSILAPDRSKKKPAFCTCSYLGTYLALGTNYPPIY